MVTILLAGDDCCVGENVTSKQSLQYNAIKEIDPWHVIVGALQCTQGLWQWSDVPSYLPPAATAAPAPPSAVMRWQSQPRLQLSLDVLVWEDYRFFSFPPSATAVTPGEIRRGLEFEPLVNAAGLWNWGPGPLHSMTRVTP